MGNSHQVVRVFRAKGTLFCLYLNFDLVPGYFDVLSNKEKKKTQQETNNHYPQAGGIPKKKHSQPQTLLIVGLLDKGPFS